mgnify:CR=1 FL=1
MEELIERLRHYSEIDLDNCEMSHEEALRVGPRIVLLLPDIIAQFYHCPLRSWRPVSVRLVRLPRDPR